MSSSPHLFAGILTKAFPLLLNQTPWPSLYTRTASNCCFHTYLFCGEMLESLKVLHQGHRSCEQGFIAALFSPTRPTLLVMKAPSIFLFPVASLVPAEQGSSSLRGSVGKCLGRDEQRWKGVLQFKEGINGLFRGLWKQAASWHSYVVRNAAGSTYKSCVMGSVLLKSFCRLSMLFYFQRGEILAVIVLFLVKTDTLKFLLFYCCSIIYLLHKFCVFYVSNHLNNHRDDT